MLEAPNSLKLALGFESISEDEFDQILSEDFELALPMLQAVIAELARYAIQEIHKELRLNEGEGTFHSRRFSHWVEQKARARLIPIGVPESHIRRATLCTLKMKHRDGDVNEERWKDEDRYKSSYFETGEIFRIGNGNNLPGPDRYVELNNLVYIISSKPTQALANDFQQAGLPFQIHQWGMMRVLVSDMHEKLLINWSRQPVASFLSIPPLVYEVFSETNDFEERKSLLLQRVQERDSRPVDEYFRYEGELNRGISATNRGSYYFGSSFGRFIDFSHSDYLIQKQHTLLKISEQYSPNQYALVWSANPVPSGGSLRNISDTTRISTVQPVEAPYVLRLIDESGKQPRAIRDEDILILSKSPPASGQRLLMMFGCQRILEDGQFRGRYVLQDSEAMDTLMELLAEWNNYEAI